MSHPSTDKHSPLPAGIDSYRAFWPHYLREHSRASTRALHFLGTGTAFLALVCALATQSVWLLPLAVLSGYGPAWSAHYFLEKNRPATFRYPLWSLVSDVRMAALWAGGRLGSELERAGVSVTRCHRG